MDPAASDQVDRTNCAPRCWHQPVDNRGLSDTGVSDEHADPPGQAGSQPRDVGVQVRAAGHNRWDTERLVGRQQLARVTEIGFCEAQQRFEPSVVRRDQAPVDQPRPWRRVGECGDDHELIGVGNDDALDRIVVIGRTSKRRRARIDAHDARKSVRLAADVADQPHPVADDNAAAAELSGPHRGHGPAVDRAAVASAVDGGDEAWMRVVVHGTLPGSWPGPVRAPDPDVVLVELTPAAGQVVASGWASIPAHIAVNPGSVLPVVATFST